MTRALRAPELRVDLRVGARRQLLVGVPGRHGAAEGRALAHETDHVEGLELLCRVVQRPELDGGQGDDWCLPAGAPEVVPC